MYRLPNQNCLVKPTKLPTPTPTSKQTQAISSEPDQKPNYMMTTMTLWLGRLTDMNQLPRRYICTVNSINIAFKALMYYCTICISIEMLQI